MNKMARGLSYLIAACFEAVAVVFGVSFAAKWLEANHPQTFRWIVVLMPIGILVIAHTFYVVLRTIIRLEKSPPEGGGSRSDGN